MRKFILLVICVSIGFCINAQQNVIDSLNNVIANIKKDTSKIDLYEKLAWEYRKEKKIDSAIWSYQHALEINEKHNYLPFLQRWDVAAIDYLYYEMGNYLESLKYAIRHLDLSEKTNDTAQRGAAHLVFGHDYRELGYYKESLKHYFEAKKYFKEFHEGQGRPEDNKYTVLCIAQVYLKMNQLDSALLFIKNSYEQAPTNPNSDSAYLLLSYRILGDIYRAKGDDQTAMEYYQKYIPAYTRFKERNRDIDFALVNLAGIFQKRGLLDSSASYARRGLESARKFSDQENIYAAGMLLSDYYEGKDDHEAFKYLKLANEARDRMLNTDKQREAQILLYNEQVREKEKAAADAKEKARLKLIIIVAAIFVLLVSFLIWNRIRQLRLRYKANLEQKEAEKIKAKYEKQLLELEAKALRAQMNPHFIFNCMNSIKSLMQENEMDKGVTYLTTFSKLIRTLFNNADKKEISLYDEIETCKLYLQLESMRFDSKFSYSLNIDENIDLKSIQVPALIIQPFIENAIWHGIVPKGQEGHIELSVMKKNDAIEISVDDNGIGREASKQNKPASGIAHQSKGVNLTQSRLELDNLLQQRQAELEIIDKKNENCISAGTNVVIRINQEIP